MIEGNNESGKHYVRGIKKSTSPHPPSKNVDRLDFIKIKSAHPKAPLRELIGRTYCKDVTDKDFLLKIHKELKITDKKIT